MDRDDGLNDGLETDDNLYELDVDDDSTDAVQAAIDEAVAAVEKRRGPGEAASEDGSGGGSSSGSSSNDEASKVEAQKLQERLMRTLADFDNFRKRTEREKQDLRRYAMVDMLRDLLGVFDNLDRALSADGNVDELKEGLAMVMRQHDDVLKRHGVARVTAVGEAFDPTVHEAVMREESTEVQAPTVTKELQSGYKIHDRLLRPAMVNVAVPADSKAD